ncbi:hypothetical protein NN561_014894 [Cricetulus griseus]
MSSRLFGAVFTVGPVTANQRWRFTCYGHHASSPQLWSVPSNHLELLVSGVHDGKPTLSALPSAVVTSVGNVTLQCMSSIGFDGFILTGADLKFPRSQKAQFTNQTMFYALFPEISVTYSKNGPFRCYGYYTNSRYVWSETSNPLEIHVSGIYSSKLTLSALPSPLLTPGRNITLQCGSQQAYDRFILLKEDQKFSSAVSSQNIHDGLSGAHFRVGPVTHNQSWRFTCYGYYLNNSQVWSMSSNDLQLLVSGVYSSKLTLSAFPSPVVTPGRNVTLQCGSQRAYDKFILINEDQNISSAVSSLNVHRRLLGAHFNVGPVTPNLRWRFTCYGYYLNNSQVWSVSSNVLRLPVSGLSRKPYLVTQQGTVLAPGKNLTLKCFSETNDDRFALYKEGEHDLTQVSACQSQDGHFHAKFTVGYGNYFIGGRYRCLGAHSNSSEWSAPSDPLDILITGSARHQKAVIGVSVVLFLLLFLLILFLLRLRHQSKDRKGAPTQLLPSRKKSCVRRGPGRDMPEVTASRGGEISGPLSPLYGPLSPTPSLSLFGMEQGSWEVRWAGIVVRGRPARSVMTDAAVKIKQPADRVELDVLSPSEEDPSKDLYAQVKPSRRRRAEMTSYSIQPRKSQGSHERKTKGHQAIDEQAARSDRLDDVTYAQLHIMTPRQGQVDLPSSRKKRPT